MQFVWFWSYWHWSTESYRCGSLLRGPVHGIGSHWEEWYNHEASPAMRDAIAAVGAHPRRQREFVLWLARRWAPEALWSGERPSIRFVLKQLAQRAPFNRWVAFEAYRESYGLRGVRAVVLAADSQGEAGDVRLVEATMLPKDADLSASQIVTEGFDVDRTELNTARLATMNLLDGRSLRLMLALWIGTGRRPYPRSLSAAIALGWALSAALLLYLVVGPDPGNALRPLATTLLALWTVLVVLAVVVALGVSLGAAQAGRAWKRLIGKSQLRLHMSGGLKVQGGSAGLAFAINLLLSVARMHPEIASESWLWRRIICALRARARSWVATGVIEPDGAVKSVVLDAKLRAALQDVEVTDMLTPRQRGANERALGVQAELLAPVSRADGGIPIGATHGASTVATPRAAAARLGFAATRRTLVLHRCRNIAQAVIAISGMASRRQIAVNALALATSVVMLIALRDLRAIVAPPPAPQVVLPISPSPYQLWVSLDTPEPRYFSVVLESQFWANRRSTVESYTGANASTRAELRLTRLLRPMTEDLEDGTVWVERRRRLLTREFAPGERVGRYTFSHIIRIGNDPR